MRDDLPPLPLYYPVLSRLGDSYRRQGGGWTFRCPFPHRHKNGDRNPSCYVKVGARGELHAHCNGCGAGWEEFKEFVGLPAGAWFPDQGRWRLDTPRVESKCVAEYPYRDRDGSLVAVKCRWEPGFHGQPKEFTWKRPVVDPALRQLLAAQGVPESAEAWANATAGGTYRGAQKAGRWKFWRVGSGGCPESGPEVDLPTALVGPYRQPEVLAADPQAPVVCVEGEGKADLLASLGFVTTSGPAGKGKWQSEWGDLFAGRRAVVIPDRDHPDALTWGERVAASAIVYGAASVRVVLIPFSELPPAGSPSRDIKDWLSLKFPGGRGTTPDKRAAVAGLCKRFPEYKRHG